MQVKTYRASTMHEALAIVRRELGPDAAVLHTREVRSSRLFGLVSGPREIEVTASAEVNVPSRLSSSRSSMERSTLPANGVSAAAGGPAAYAPAPSPSAPSPPAFSPPAPAALPSSEAMPFDGPVSMPQTPMPQTPMPQTPMPPNPSSAEPLSEWPTGQTAFGQQPAPVPEHFQTQIDHLQEMVGELCRRSQCDSKSEWPEPLFRLFTGLLDADVNEELARNLVERVRCQVGDAELAEPMLLKARVGRMLEDDIRTTGPIAVTPGQCRLVALVGPTGVGKTTTIAKLAANYRLREKHRVGLITVDTYRIAAVEQLRTYADIIDLPMEVVSTPREMRTAVERMQHLDLVLIDTAGRSPRDEVKIQELKAFLQDAEAHEIHLVLSSVSGSRALQQTAERFATVGTTALMLTKLDEATGLGNVMSVLRSSRLPVSYLTDGQNVPDDIETADAHRLSQMILGAASSAMGDY